jgi:hypothetical protein
VNKKKQVAAWQVQQKQPQALSSVQVPRTK